MRLSHKGNEEGVFVWQKDREWAGNKGEWSELYVFLKLLAQGAVQAIDEKLEKLKTFIIRLIKLCAKSKGNK